MGEHTIGQVARRLGVRTSALRFYEARGILPPAPRRNGHRRYDDEMVRTIEVALFAQSVGFSLAEIRQLFAVARRHPLNARWEPLARAKLRELDAVIERAQRMKAAIASGLECGCIRWTDCRPASAGASGRHEEARARRQRDQRA